MKIKCLHGYFIFEEQRAGEVSDFISLTGLNLVRKENYFTFEALETAPDYAIKGSTYLGAAVTKTFAGKPWEILEANSLIYNFDTGLLVPITSVTQRTSISAAGNVYVSPGLILPGSLTDEGARVRDYAAWFSTETMRFRYSEVSYVD